MINLPAELSARRDAGALANRSRQESEGDTMTCGSRSTLLSMLILSAPAIGAYQSSGETEQFTTMDEVIVTGTHVQGLVG
jgi:hypothetical protein